METSLGKFMWADLTVDNATAVRDFYCAIANWTWEAIAMGDYDDYVMKNANGDVVGGICHRKGANDKLPPFWINYLTVESVNASAGKCVSLGGTVIDGPRKMGEDIYTLIQDPAGAYIALYGKP